MSLPTTFKVVTLEYFYRGSSLPVSHADSSEDPPGFPIKAFGNDGLLEIAKNDPSD
jgi:hypothetical protein